MKRQDAKVTMAGTRSPVLSDPCWLRYSWRLGVLAVHRLAASHTAHDANSKRDCPAGEMAAKTGARVAGRHDPTPSASR